MNEVILEGVIDHSKVPDGVVFAWGVPANGAGYIWCSTEAMTDEDFKFFRGWISEPHMVGGIGLPGLPLEEFDKDPWLYIQQSTILGTHHKDYTTSWVEEAINDDQYARRKRGSGGLGSIAYENQHLPSGVRMPEPIYRPGGAKYTKGFWYFDSEENMVRGIPSENCGAHHRLDDVNVEGPMPGSDAEKKLKTKVIYWNEHKGWFALKDK